ncbi:hypothetical protein H4F69_19235 [Pectobacterium brasiliense]|uniref:Uncharacterized protein n=1 Tax=Pectobacterium brasiliense TaxID=180957 RepID=A0A3S0XJS4_9GAMM|nr:MULTISPECIES: hypothetical protein [Pectobacterium]GKW01110.1 hypothetical protein PEC301653_41550 [Pectobacterium carotovorum subsp. carotovorum]AFR04621.1 hypothetical protein PCC21_032180 [Pectobacterium carotovorum subsp. carotovorum PCC21]MBN3048651.1 hypothetical protein [Pectobacterium brasiliense]MBN3057909.1 hypothetical protein [Pectobacterium brasiliense]MBN3074740.1 hypothetical protein [Pectobacterium brasiliense]
MEKSLKLTSSNFNLTDINFNSFSSSNKWVGCFEKKTPFSTLLIDDSIDIVRSFFSPHWDDFFALSALSFNDEREVESGILKEYGEIYNDAKINNYLKPLSDDFESYLYGDIPLPASSLSLHFDNGNFMDVCKLIMGHGGVLGQVFFMINLKLQLAIYPHGDIGFGVISFDKDDVICKSFLNSLIGNDDFNIIM